MAVMLPEPILVEWEPTYSGRVRPLTGIPDVRVQRPPLVRGFADSLLLRQRGGAPFFDELKPSILTP